MTALLVAIFSGSLLILTMPRSVSVYDEGIILTDAMLVAAGQIPHRDFYSVYGPAQYYIVAGLQSLTGENFLSARLYDVSCKLFLCGLIAYIIRNTAGLLITLMGAGVVMLWLVNFSGFSLYPIYPCIILGLLATYLMIPVAAGQCGFRGSALRSAAGGACAGATALFRYDVGFYLLIANLIGSGIVLWFRATTGHVWKRFVLIVIAYGLGTALVSVPFATVFLTVASWKSFWHDIIAFPSTYYPAMRGLPFPPPWTTGAAAIYLAPVVAMAGLTEALRLSRAVRSDLETNATVWIQAALVMFSLCALCFFIKGIVRVSPIHMFPGNVPAFIVAAILARCWLKRSRGAQAIAILLMLFAFAPPVLDAARVMKAVVLNPSGVMAGALAQKLFPRIAPAEDGVCQTTSVSGVAIYSPDFAKAANFIVRRTTTEDKIFVGLSHHDKIFINSVAMYFAIGRLPGTHWHHFDPGLQTRADIQAEIISDLKANHVQWVVRDGSIGNPNEPNGSARSSGVTLLDQYIQTSYRPVASAGPIEVLLAKSSLLPNPNHESVCEARAID